MSGYVNGNVEIHRIEKTKNYKWSSFNSFIEKGRNEILNDKDIILSQFKNSRDYKIFVDEVIKDSRKRKETLKGEMEKYLLE